MFIEKIKIRASDIGGLSLRKVTKAHEATWENKKKAAAVCSNLSLRTSIYHSQNKIQKSRKQVPI